MKSPKIELYANGISTFCKNILFYLFIAASLSSYSQGPQLAFPTASGAGSFVSGGRGKPVYVVTNLNDSGPGSFRQCLEDTRSSDGGIITFAVSGTINLQSEIYFSHQDNITIAGQTAPEGGITIANHRFRMQNVNNFIMRYIRLRPNFDPYPGTELDPLEYFNAHDYIIDHCSFSWGTDEAAESGIGHTYTWQRNLFAESNKTGMIIGYDSSECYDESFLNNMFYNCSHRFPNWVSDDRVDIINNVVWNWIQRIAVPQGGFEVNHINNYYVHFRNNPPADTDFRGILWYPFDVQEGGASPFPTIYTSGNYISDVLTDPNADNWFFWRFRFNPSGTVYSGAGAESQLTEDFRTLTPFTQLGNPIQIKSAVDAFEDLKYNVGSNARLNALGERIEEIDKPDSLYLKKVRDGILVPYTQESNMTSAHFNEFQQSVSSTPINSHPANYYSSLDGIPNSWKQLKGLDLNTDYTTFVWPSGYVGIEEYLNLVDFPETGETFGDQVTVTSDATNNTICEGETITLTADGADSYSWNTGATTQSIDVSPTTTTPFTVTGTHANADDTSETITITVNPIPTANAGNDLEICQGESVTLTASGGTSYLWSTGQTTESINVSPNTTFTYSVEVTENGCTSDPDEITVTVNPLPSVDAGLDQIINFGDTIELSANGADSYEWSTGETTQTITVSPSIETTYTVIGTTGSCENSDSVTVFLSGSEVVANAGNDQSICNGSQTTLTATGGAAYAWNTGETTASIEVSPNVTTTYTVTVFDESGLNSDTDDVIVEVNVLPNTNAGADETITEGETITLTASGASNYLWSTGEETASIEVSPMVDTTYSVTGYSNASCEATDEITVFVETEQVIADAGDDVSICQGASTILTASGGVTYLWSTGEDTPSIEVSPNNSTTYTVTAFNTLGNASDTDEVMVSVLGLPNVDAGSNVSINEGESITLTASGAATYLWSTGEETASIEVSPMVDTTYSVTGYSNAGCEATDNVTIFIDTEVVEADAGDDVSICQGASTILTASGGVTYLWSTGEDTPSIEVSPNNSTTYTVTAFNTLGNASDTDEVMVSVLGLPNVDAGSNVSINEGESITLTASGAATYLWSTGEETASIEVSPNTDITYSVTGFSNAGCESTDTITVFVETEQVFANAGADVSICEGDSVTLAASGGAIYVWNTGEETSTIEVSPNTTTVYTVTVFNSLGTASDTDEVTVTVNALPIVDAGSDVTITEGETITLSANGADTYSWNTGENTQSVNVSPTSTTTYTVIGFSNGCEASDEVTVFVDTEQVFADAGADVSICEGDIVTLTASGGATYVWSTGEETSTIEVSPNTTTTFSVTVFNSLGTASDTDEVTVTVNALPAVDAGSDVTISEGETITLSANGADTYSWNTGANTENINVSPTITTTYTVTGFSNGCEASDDVTVIVIPISFEASAGPDVSICEGTDTVLTASEGDAYLWSTGETTQSITVSPWATETFTVTVFEDDEQADADVTVFVNLNPEVVIMNGGSVDMLEGEFITLSASGANDYEWNNGATEANIAVSPSETIAYEVTGFINNCSDTESVTVNVYEQVIADAGEDTFICTNEIVTLYASGGDDYLWSNGETTPSIQVSPGEDTEYSVLVYNALDAAEATVMVYVNECVSEEIPPIVNNQEFEFLVYQDTRSDMLKVQISGMNNVDVNQILIYDLTGKVVYTENITQEDDQISLEKEINSSNLSRGVYIVRLMYDDTDVIKKIPIR